SGSGQTRTEIWQAAVTAIKDRPLFGWGADNFTFAFSRLKPIEYLRDAGSASKVDNAHNYPLHLATGIGIVGALLFFGICVWTGVRSFRTVFGRSEGSEHIVLGAFWAASAGYLAHLLAGLSIPGITFLLWMAMALVLAPTARTREVKPLRWGAPVAALVVLLAGMGIAGQVIVLAADSAYVDSQDEFSITYDDRAAAAVHAVEFNPYSPEHRAALALTRAEQMASDLSTVLEVRESDDDPTPYVDALKHSFAEAESACMDAIAFTPQDYANYVNLAAVYNYAAPVLGEDLFHRSIETVELGLEVMPLGTAIRVQLAKALVGIGKETEAVQTLEYCLQLDQRDGNAALNLAYIYHERGNTAEALAVLKSVEAIAPGQAGIANTIKALEAEAPSE
ncbi:MAG: O-antigen ligase family protein, partial [Thermoleophilia bacterium]|nr:O-antigen ligase family protein [Thermoleophilia bacterium]